MLMAGLRYMFVELSGHEIHQLAYNLLTVPDRGGC